MMYNVLCDVKQSGPRDNMNADSVVYYLQNFSAYTVSKVAGRFSL